MLRTPFLALPTALCAILATASCAELLLVPLDCFGNRADAKKVSEVLDHCTFQHTLKDTRFISTPGTFNYLLDRMPFTTTVMRELKLAKYVVTTRPDGVMWCDDNDGMVGTFEPVYCTDAKRVFYGNGTFDAPILGKIRGESVIVLDYVQDEPGTIRNTVTIFLRVHSFFAPIMKLAAPIVKGMVTRKSASLLGACTKLAEQLSTDPQSLYDQIRTSESITEDEQADFRKAFLPDTVMREPALPVAQ